MTQIIVEDEDGEVVKTYELPSRPKKEEDAALGAPIRQGVKRVGTWTGLGKDKHDAAAQGQPESSKAGASASRPEPRQGLSRMGTWGFGGKNSEAAKNERPSDQSDEDDDRRIRFTIGGAGRRLTKDDFLKEIRSLDPKARSEIIEESDAPAAMKAMAKKDASKDSPGTSRLFEAKDTQAAAGKGEAKSVGAEMARQRGARVDMESEEEVDERPRQRRNMRAEPGVKPTTTMSSTAKTSSGNEPESAAEKKRREKALRGVDDITDAQRGRSPTRDEPPQQPQETAAARRRRLAMEGGGGTNARIQSLGVEGESVAEKRRREAALGVGVDNQEDSDDDDTPRVPPPVAKSRGIRFAQSPIRGKK